MRPREAAKRDLVRQWVLRAQKDFSLARHLVAEGCQYPEAIGFNCQQAAEKFLKAFLVLHQTDFPKTHNLGELLDLVASIDPALAESPRELTTLNPYGVEYRYPSDFPEMMQDDAVAAFQLAEAAWDAVMPRLASHLDTSPGPE
jgi:HEPN domain-containing protein